MAWCVAAACGGAAHGAAEDDNAFPFPPGKNAALVRKICGGCHDGQLVVAKRYDECSARKYYQVMVGDPTTDEARKVIEYLVNVLADKDE